MLKFSRHDAERMQKVSGLVQKWCEQRGLTSMDLLLSVRFALANKYAWEEAVEEATERHSEWLAYYDDGRHEESAGDRYYRGGHPPCRPQLADLQNFP